MSKTTYTFEGTVNYLLTKPDKKFGKFTVKFYPKDAAERKKLRDTGIRNKPNEDEDGNFFFVLRSDEKYPITTEDGTPIDVLVGNGSGVKLRLEVEAFESQKWGKVTRSKIVGVVVTNLIEYKRPEETAEPQSELPA